MLEAGKVENPAVILLHGSCSNSAAWLGDIPTLADKFHVFAVDILGEAGNSEEYRLDIDSDQYPQWLAELLDLLSIFSICIPAFPFHFIFGKSRSTIYFTHSSLYK